MRVRARASVWMHSKTVKWRLTHTHTYTHTQIEPPPGHEMTSDEHDSESTWLEEEAKESQNWRDLALDQLENL